MPNPGKFDARYHPQMIKWATRSGLTEEEVCKELKISKSSLYRWKAKYPEVAAGMRESRDYVDSQVEDSLLKRAMGYDVEETRILGTRTDKGVTVERFEKTKRHIMPDVGAGAFWLKCRRGRIRGRDPRTTWQEVHRIEQEFVQGSELPPDELTHEELLQEIRATEAEIDALERAGGKNGSPTKPDTLH